jgi:polyisoprenoid-binding protein YceI
MSTIATPSVVPAGTWVIDPVHSQVGFAVKHMGIAIVRGEFTDFQGALEIGDDLSSSRAHGTVRTASVDTRQPQRDADLRSANFFDADQYPELSFESTDIEALDEDDLRITGKLTIHGVTNDVVLRAEVQGSDIDPYGNERVGLEVTGELSRGDFGMKFTQALGSGNLVVSDNVKITLDLSAVKRSA